MARELRVFLTSLTFLTRVRVPWDYGWDPRWLHEAIRWYPVVGALVGGLGALALWVTSLVLPWAVAVPLSVLWTIWITGAFHEDGFADVCDGFGGGMSAERVLTIMKDSRLGTYGTIGLVGMLATKTLALHALGLGSALWILPVAHSLSRVTPAWFMATASYVQDTEASKVKPMGYDVGWGTLAVVHLWALLALAAVTIAVNASSLSRAITAPALLLGGMVVVFVAFRRLALRKVGGFSGDILGALQQLTELSLYLSLLVWRGLAAA